MNSIKQLEKKNISKNLKTAKTFYEKVWLTYKKIVIPLNCILIFLFSSLLVVSGIIFWISSDNLLQHALKNGINVKQYLSDPKNVLNIENWTNRNFVSIVLVDICGVLGILTLVSMANEIILTYLNKVKVSKKKIILYSIIGFFILLISVFILIIFNTSNIPVSYDVNNGFSLAGKNTNTPMTIIKIDSPSNVKWIDLFPATSVDNIDSSTNLNSNQISIGNFKLIMGSTMGLVVLINLTYIASNIIKFFISKK